MPHTYHLSKEVAIIHANHTKALCVVSPTCISVHGAYVGPRNKTTPRQWDCWELGPDVKEETLRLFLKEQMPDVEHTIINKRA